MQRASLGVSWNIDNDEESDTGMGRQPVKDELVTSYQGEQLELNLGGIGK